MFEQICEFCWRYRFIIIIFEIVTGAPLLLKLKELEHFGIISGVVTVIYNIPIYIIAFWGLLNY